MHCEETEHENQLLIQFSLLKQEHPNCVRIRKRCLYESDTLQFKLQSEYILEKTRQKIPMDFVRV